jgi:hypothetical protein
MAFKDMAAQLIAPLDINFAKQSFLLLLPEQWDAASDLHETKEQVLSLKDKLALDKISNI